MNAVRRSRIGACAPLLAAALVVALVASLLPLAQASAYYNLGTVSVQAGAARLTVQAGSTTSASVSVTPASDDQTLGCGMAQCPQVCTSGGAAEAGYTCFDVNGQCTCAGKAYSTYYAEVSATSSNSGVATAYVSGGTLVVQGHAAGSATITVNASLRQWTSGSTTVQVDVTAPATSGGSSSSGGSGSMGGAATAAPGSSGGAGASAQGGSGAHAAASAGASTAAIPQEAEVAVSRDDAKNETVTETVAGTVYSVEANSYLDTAEELGRIAGTGDQAVFWSGPSSDKPIWSWTFRGEDVSAEGASQPFDPTITVSKLGTGDVSNIMSQAKDGLVLDFAHDGMLPGKASIYVKVDGTFPDGSSVGLYLFSDAERRFERVQDGVSVADGYASFTIDHCSTWALSTDDLTGYAVEETNTPGAIAADSSASIAADEPSVPVAGIAGGVVVVACVAVAAAIAVRRRRAGAGAAVDVESAAEAGAAPEGREKAAAGDEAAGDEAAAAAPATGKADASEAAGEPVAPGVQGEKGAGDADRA